MDNLKLYEKIYLVMCDSEAIEKTMTVGSGNNSYKAVSEAAMLNLVKPLFKKHKLIVFPIEGDIKDNAMTWEKTDTYKGTVKQDLRAITELKVMYKIVDIESGESEILVGFGNGADPQDKGAGKAFTYSFKNMLSKTFMLFSGEDTDNTHSDDINIEKPPKNTTTGTTPPKGTNTPPTKTITPTEVESLTKLALEHNISTGSLKATILKDFKLTKIEYLTEPQFLVMKAKIMKQK